MFLNGCSKNAKNSNKILIQSVFDSYLLKSGGSIIRQEKLGGRWKVGCEVEASCKFGRLNRYMTVLSYWWCSAVDECMGRLDTFIGDSSFVMLWRVTVLLWCLTMCHCIWSDLWFWTFPYQKYGKVQNHRPSYVYLSHNAYSSISTYTHLDTKEIVAHHIFPALESG